MPWTTDAAGASAAAPTAWGQDFNAQALWAITEGRKQHLIPVIVRECTSSLSLRGFCPRR